jgi:hypothetical protein
LPYKRFEKIECRSLPITLPDHDLPGDGGAELNFCHLLTLNTQPEPPWLVPIHFSVFPLGYPAVIHSPRNRY